MLHSHFQIPKTVTDYELDISIVEGRRLMRKRFELYMKVEDVRLIDMLVIKVSNSEAVV